MALLFTVQVLVTALLAGLIWLVILENDGYLSLPWLFSPEVTVVAQWQGLLGLVLLGALWGVLMLAPVVIRLFYQRNQAQQLAQRRGQHLQQVLDLTTPIAYEDRP